MFFAKYFENPEFEKQSTFVPVGTESQQNS